MTVAALGQSSPSLPVRERAVATCFVKDSISGTRETYSSANAVTAAAKMGGDVHVLVAGTNTKSVGEAASKLAGVSKVLHVDAAHYDGGIPENYAALVGSIAKGYS